MHLWDRFGSTVPILLQLVYIFGRHMIIIDNTSKGHALVFVRLTFPGVRTGISCASREKQRLISSSPSSVGAGLRVFLVCCCIACKHERELRRVTRQQHVLLSGWNVLESFVNKT